MPLEVMPKADLELEKYRAVCRAGVERLLRDSEGRKAGEQAYGAWLGFYNGNKKNCGGWNNTQLVQTHSLTDLTRWLLGGCSSQCMPRASPLSQ